MTQQQQSPNAPVAAAAGAVAGQAPVPASMGRIAVASAIGTMCEFYDFNIYGTAAALVFPHIFFPALGTAAGTAASFATLGVAFVARPFGSILFGHFGDRLGSTPAGCCSGRKRAEGPARGLGDVPQPR